MGTTGLLGNFFHDFDSGMLFCIFGSRTKVLSMRVSLIAGGKPVTGGSHERLQTCGKAASAGDFDVSALPFEFKLSLEIRRSPESLSRDFA